MYILYMFKATALFDWPVRDLAVHELGIVLSIIFGLIMAYAVFRGGRLDRRVDSALLVQS